MRHLPNSNGKTMTYPDPTQVGTKLLWSRLYSLTQEVLSLRPFHMTTPGKLLLDLYLLVNPGYLIQHDQSQKFFSKFDKRPI